MGVIGLDLFSSRLDGMPGKLGRPRYQSKHKLHANNTLTFDGVMAEFAKSEAPAEAVAV